VAAHLDALAGGEARATSLSFAALLEARDRREIALVVRRWFVESVPSNKYTASVSAPGNRSSRWRKLFGFGPSNADLPNDKPAVGLVDDLLHE